MKKSKSTTRQTLGLFWNFTKKYKTLFWLGTSGSFVGVIVTDILPQLIIAKAFSVLQSSYNAHEMISFAELLPYIASFALCMVVSLIVWRIQLLCVWRYELNAIRDMIIQIFDHLQRQGQRFHSDRFGGALVSQSTKFIRSYEKIMDEFTWSVVTGITALVASLCVLFLVAPLYAGIMVLIIVLYLAIMYPLIRKQFAYNVAETIADSNRTAALADMITNASNVRSFAAENHELARFKTYADKSFFAGINLMRQEFRNSMVSQFITNGFKLVAFVFGVYAITSLDADAGVLYLVISYTGSITDRLWQFGRVMRNLNNALGDAVEMTEIFAIPVEVQDPLTPQRSKIVRGAIKFDNVTFSHESGGTLFKNLNFRIKPGEKVGLVGSSGSGKTTLTRLLLRFIDINSGTISIDGQDITAIKQSNLRSHISYVAQEPMLFHRSLRENIQYGQRDANLQAIEGVSKMAHAHEFIGELAQGYNTLVGERGVKLSGGQRQRVAIARAMLKNAPILVLDEATSALDSESEVLIQDALWKLMQNRTAIVIAHRLSTIQKMDRIIVLDKGAIVEEGSHKELLKQKGVYAKLWSHQSGGFIEE